MKAEEVEIIAKALYELDRQKELQSHRWLAGAESKRDGYRLKARDLLAVESFARVIARLNRQCRHIGDLIYRPGGTCQPRSGTSARP
jgi:hypothetical protein